MESLMPMELVQVDGKLKGRRTGDGVFVSLYVHPDDQTVCAQRDESAEQAERTWKCSE